MLNRGLSRHDGGLVRLVAVVALLGAMLFVPALAATEAQSAQGVKIAVVGSLSGFGMSAGIPVLDAARLAVEEANAVSGAPPIELAVYDDQSSTDGAKAVAGQIVASDTPVVVGHDISIFCLAAGPLYAEAGLATISPTAHSDKITDHATTFRMIFSTYEMGSALADYLYYALGGKRAVVIFKDNGYGRPVMEGFKATAERLGMATAYHPFTAVEEAVERARRTAAEPESPALVLGGMLDDDATPVLAALRRQGAQAPILGSSAIANDSFAEAFASYPEYRKDQGFFTNGVYAISPSIPDSANAETLAFADRYRARYGREPQWEAVQGYDTTRLAISAVRAAVATETSADTKLNVQSRRAAVRNYLTSLDSPARAITSLTGPLWFTPERGRQQATRIGRFYGAHFESAPLQIVPVTKPVPADIASGAVFELGPGRYARLQRVVYTGVFINEIPHLDLTRASFNADFYLWLRFARDAGPDSADPTDLIFPNMMSGSFDRTRPAEQGRMADGSEYWLWRVQGEFRNDFDLHHFPFDRQALSLSFFNARAPMERIVYVMDKRTAAMTQNSLSPPPNSGNAAAARITPAETLAIASPDAFRNLTQWEPLSALSRRENLVTHSALGDPRRIGVDSHRELSGFLVNVEVERRAVATLVKSLLPLLLMTLIMYASLYFPPALLKEKVTVAVTGALSGAVLLSAINNQLGGIGYTIAVEYVFYLFFALSLLCIVSVLSAERLRVAGRSEAAVRAERWTRRVFALSAVGTLLGALGLYWSR